MPDLSSKTLDPQKKYFNAIDGLRLLASVNVVLFHLEYIGGFHNMGGSPGWFFRLVKGPAFHASLFFILGGFIFTTKFAQAHIENKFSNTSFLKKRFRELYPLHLITTLMMAAFYIIRRWGTDGIDIPKLCYSLFMHLSFLWSIWPQGTLTLNTPSWALSAMFLCYLLFKPVLHFSLMLKTRQRVFIFMLLSILPLALWGYFYAQLGMPQEFRQFFHGFAPIRFFEFALGVLLARFFMLAKNDVAPSSSTTSTTSRTARITRTSTTTSWLVAILCDVAMIFSIYAIIYNLTPAVRFDAVSKWFSYHVYMIPIFALMIYAMATERGIFARIFSLSIIRKLGRTSFYPYLLHIPLITCVTVFCENVLGYRRFLHSPINVAIFVILLYGGSYVYVFGVKKRKSK